MAGWRGWGATPRRVRENLPLSPNEERYILAESMTGQVYIAPSAMRIRGPVDMDLMERSIQATCDRHEARRTGFERAPDGGFTKYVLDRAQVRVKRLSMPGASEDELKDVIRRHVYEKGDFSPETLHRYIFIKLAPQDWVLAHAFHHATSDGVTSNSFMLEMFGRVFGFPMDAPAPQYSDYWDFDWRNSEAYQTARDFWIERLEGLEAGGVLPPDRQDPAPAQARPGLSLPIPREVVDSTRRAAETLGVTHFTFFYAVYLILLSRLTGADRVCTTFQSAGRRGKAGAEGAHGVFSNSLILGVRIDEGETLRALAGRLRVEIREAIAHEIFPYHHVIRATGLHPKYAINWYPQGPSGEVHGVTFEGLDLIENQDDDDLNVRFLTYLEEMSLVVFYDATRFGEARVRAIAEQLLALANAFAEHLDTPIRERPSRFFVGDAAQEVTAPLPQGAPSRIFDAVLERARETSEAVAVACGPQRLSYGDLERASRSLAQSLRAQGVGPGDRVAIVAERDPRLVCAMLAAARAGAAFCVLDAAHPEPHLARLAETIAPRTVMWAGAPRLVGLAERLAAEVKAMTLEAVIDASAEAGFDGLDAANPDDPAYIVFTSGSTGRPKAVASSHRPLVHFLAWQAQTFGLTAADRFGFLSGLAHDPALRDIFAPLSLGATVAIPDLDVLQPGALAEWLRRERVGAVCLTPPLGQVLVAGRSARLPDLTHVFWGGDLLRPGLVKALADRASQARQVNFYGTTETPQAVSFHEIGPDLDADLASAPIGRGAAGAQLLVLGAAGAPAGPGELGDIAVRSNLLSLGEVVRGAIQPPTDRLTDGHGAGAIYATGDRGFSLPDGAVMLVGRRDDQVKVRGHRIELAEVTAALQALPQVRTGAVLPVGEPVRLVAFVTGPRGLDAEAVRSSLAARLPAPMVPAEVRRLDLLPLSPNGKVDRAALAAELVAAAAPAANQPAVAASRTERALMDAWSEVLSREVGSRGATFASLGGDSLSYVQAYLALEELTGEPPEGWQLMTIGELAARKPAAREAGWTAVDMPILIRAGAIFLVTAGHFGVLQYGGGATSILMLVSGYLLGGLALQEAFARHEAAPVLKTLTNILVPTLALSAALWLFRMPGHPPQPYILLLTADLQDYNARHNGQDFYLWFVHCLLHMMLLFYLAVAALKLVGGFRIGIRRFLWAVFVVACVGRFVLPWDLDHNFFAPAHHRELIYVLPTTHLATLALGGLAATAGDRRQRLAVGAMVIVYALASAWCFGPNQGVFLLAGGLLLTAAPRLSLPRLLTPAVLSIAAASLWIYLTHMMVRDGLKRLHLDQPALGLALALAVGVGVWFLWRRGVQLAGRVLRRPAPLLADAV